MALTLRPEKRVEEVAGEGLSSQVVITGVQVKRFLQAKGVDALQTLPFIAYLLGVREVGQRETTAVQQVSRLVFFTGTKLVNV